MDYKLNTGGIKEKTNALTDHLSDLVESYYKLGVLNVTEKVTGIASTAITVLVVSFLALFALLFLGFGFGWWLGQQLNSMLAGFSIVAGILVVSIVTLMALRKQIIFPFIRNTIIKKVYE
jgi:hypothetical protein